MTATGGWSSSSAWASATARLVSGPFPSCTRAPVSSRQFQLEHFADYELLVNCVYGKNTISYISS